MTTRAYLSAEKLIIAALLLYLSFRVLIDFIYINDKPGFAKAIFTLISFALIVYNLTKLVNKTDILLFIPVTLMIFYPLAFSQETIGGQIAYDLKVLLIPLVMLACSHLDISFTRLRKWARIVMPLVLLLALAFFLRDFSYNPIKLYGMFDNHPVHPVSQNIAKLSFLFLYGKVYIGMFLLSLLIILNVRSNLIPVFACYLYRNFRTYYKYMLFAMLFVIGLLLFLESLGYEFISIGDILERFINKNRTHGYAGQGLENISSGRTEIWAFYINFIADNYTITNYLFGTGSLEVQGKYPLNAHNDFLNVIINFGMTGLFVLTLLYIEIYKRLEPKYRNYIAFYFVFVFLTNGVMFHQSNILFLLYLRDRHPSRDNNLVTTS